MKQAKFVLFYNNIYIHHINSNCQYEWNWPTDPARASNLAFCEILSLFSFAHNRLDSYQGGIWWCEVWYDQFGHFHIDNVCTKIFGTKKILKSLYSYKIVVKTLKCNWLWRFISSLRLNPRWWPWVSGQIRQLYSPLVAFPFKGIFTISIKPELTISLASPSEQIRIRIKHVYVI